MKNTLNKPKTNYGISKLTSGTDLTGVKFKANFFDLTQMFGTTIADYIYSLEQASAGAGVAWFKKLFPANYYPYSEPTIISSQTDRVDVKSSNLIYPNMPFVDRSGYTSSGVTYTYDENRVITINGTRAKNVSGSLGLFSYGTLGNGQYTLSVYDEYGNYATDVNINVNVTPPYTFSVNDSNHNSIITILASISGKKYNNAKYYIKLEKGSKSTPYNPHIMQQITTNFPALNSAGSVYDYIDLNEGKLHQRVGVKDLGTIDFEQGGSNNKTSWVPVSWRTNVKPVSDTGTEANILCNKYYTDTADNVEKQVNDKTIAANRNSWVYIYDSAYVSVTPQEFKAAMSSVMLYYELAEEIVTDIEIPAELTDWLEVEADGSVTFHDADESKQLPVPNAVRWVRKLDEVN